MEGTILRFQIGEKVTHPTEAREGTVLEIRTNPACLMRHLLVEWENGETEEIEELEFGPLED